MPFWNFFQASGSFNGIVEKVHLAIMVATLNPDYRQDFLTYADPTQGGPQVLQDIYVKDKTTYTNVRKYFTDPNNAAARENAIPRFQAFFTASANNMGAGILYPEPQQCPCAHSGGGHCPPITDILGIVTALLILVSTSCMRGPSPVENLDPKVAASEIAWRTLAQISRSTPTGAAGWENWIDRDTLLHTPSSTGPTDAACDASYNVSVNSKKPLTVSLETTELTIAAKKPLRPPDGSSNMEIRFNSSLCKSVESQGLWQSAGAVYAAHKRQDTTLEDGSIAIKAYWDTPQPNTPCDPTYHCYVQDPATRTTIRLTALHMALKLKSTPNWFWATWEHESLIAKQEYLNGGECCRDDFGFAKPMCCTSIWGGNAGTPTRKLEAAIRDASAGKEWLHYRLVGTQTDYQESGVPSYLGNTVIEGAFAPVTSCISCHARATANIWGDSLSMFTCDCQPATGYPPASWYVGQGYGGGTGDAAKVLAKSSYRKFVRLSFIWSLTRGGRTDCDASHPLPQCCNFGALSTSQRLE